MDMPEAGFAGQGQQMAGAGHVRPPGLLSAVGAAEGEAGGIVEQFVAVFSHPAQRIRIETAERSCEIAFEHGRPEEPFAERLLPVGDDRLHADRGRLLPTAADDDGQAPTVEEEIADEGGAQQSGDAGDEQ